MAVEHDDTHGSLAATRHSRRSREQLVADYMCVVRAIAHRYRGLGLSIDDLVQEGALGLLEATERYDPERGMEFDAYARFRIRRAMRNALTDQSRLIRLPKHVVERRRAIDRAASALTNATGREPTPSELADVTGLLPDAVAATRRIGGAPVSLDQVTHPDGSPLEIAVTDGSALDPEAAAVEHEEITEVDAAVAALPTRQREIVTRHFGLGREPEEIAEVAADLHVSQQRARAIERDALATLRDQLEPAITLRATR